MFNWKLAAVVLQECSAPMKWGGWRAVIQSAPPGDDVFWISSRNAGRFNLALRLYSPDDAVLEDVHRAVLPPEIRRTGCRAEEGA